jgi:hypothetical protein
MIAAVNAGRGGGKGGGGGGGKKGNSSAVGYGEAMEAYNLTQADLSDDDEEAQDELDRLRRIDDDMNDMGF